MDWILAIEKNREALLKLVAAMVAMAGIAAVGPAPKLSRRARSALLHILRPAESALRRLIVIYARVQLKARMAAQRGRQVRLLVGSFPGKLIKSSAKRVPAFALFDRRKRFAQGPVRAVRRGMPRISFPEFDGPADVRPVALPDDLIASEALHRRVMSLRRALDTLPRQGRRLLRAEAKREAAPPGPRRVPPLRPGWPPGYRARGKHEVDQVLADCHGLARLAMEPPDTS